MSILHKTRLNSNTKVQIKNNGGQLTVDAGLTLVTEFLHSLHFEAMITELIHFQDKRKFHRHDKITLLKQVLFQLIAGYQNDSVANTLQHDPAMALILNTTKLASQPSISRFINSLTAKNIEEFNQLLLRIADTVFSRYNQQTLILDVDSTMPILTGNKKLPVTMLIMAPMGSIQS